MCNGVLTPREHAITCKAITSNQLEEGMLSMTVVLAVRWQRTAKALSVCVTQPTPCHARAPKPLIDAEFNPNHPQLGCRETAPILIYSCINTPYFQSSRAKISSLSATLGNRLTLPITLCNSRQK